MPGAKAPGFLIMISESICNYCSEPRTINEISTFVQLSKPECKVIVTELVELGRLDKSGKAKGTRYCRPTLSDLERAVRSVSDRWYPVREFCLEVFKAMEGSEIAPITIVMALPKLCQDGHALAKLDLEGSLYRGRG